MRKHQPKPTVTTRIPASAGPITRELVIERAVERDGVLDVDVGHHLGDERPAGRVVEREHEAARERDDVEGGERRVAHERQRGERERLEHLQGLGDDQQAALVGPVGDQAAPRAEQQDGPELARGEQTRSRRRCGSGGAPAG